MSKKQEVVSEYQIDIERDSSVEEGEEEDHGIQLMEVTSENHIILAQVNPIFQKLQTLRHQAKEVMDDIGELEVYLRGAAEIEAENQRLKLDLQIAKSEIQLLRGSKRKAASGGAPTFIKTSIPASPIAEIKSSIKRPRPRPSKITLQTSYSKPSTSICRARLNSVETEAWNFTLSDDTTLTYRASDYLVRDFISTLAFDTCKYDIVRFCVQAIADFLRKPEFQHTVWTITTTGKIRGTMCQLPNAFIHDVVHIAFIGFGADPDRSFWTEEDYNSFTQALNNTTFTLRDRIAKARSDSRRKKQPDGTPIEEEQGPTVIHIELANLGPRSAAIEEEEDENEDIKGDNNEEK